VPAAAGGAGCGSATLLRSASSFARGATAGEDPGLLSKRAASKLRRRSDVAAAFGSGAAAKETLRPPSSAVACGLLHACQAGRGKPERFCVLRGGFLLFYDPSKVGATARARARRRLRRRLRLRLRLRLWLRARLRARVRASY